MVQPNVCVYSAITTLTPLQLGVGVKGGCEVVIHATNHLLSSSSSNQSWCLFVDFTNAFNCISREAMFVEIRRHIPPLAAWMESCYSCQPLLHLGNDSLRSCCGVQQGDPLGSLGFALTLQPLIEKLKASVAGLGLNVWYLDDGTLMGFPGDLADALQILERDGPPLGLHLKGENHSFLFQRILMQINLPCRRTSPLHGVASPSWVAQLALQTIAKRSSRPGLRR